MKGLPALILLATLLSLLAGCSSSPQRPDGPTQVYEVQAGDTFYSIARRYGMSVSQLLALNPDVEPEHLEVGQRLYVPDVQIGRFRYPVQRPQVSSNYGPRDGRLHKGVDFRGPDGTPILAAAPGTVSFSGSMRGYGHVIIIDHPNGFQSLYAHNQANLVSKGTRVDQGETIAKMGRSGRASGSHVHFELRHRNRVLNPLPLLE